MPWDETEHPRAIKVSADIQPEEVSDPGYHWFNPETYKRFLDEGFRLLLVGGDEWMLRGACRKLAECVTSVRK